MAMGSPRTVKRKVVGSPATVPALTDHVSRAAVVALITDRVRDPADTIRDARDKVGQRINYAVKKEKLSGPPFLFGEVLAWARQKKDWRDMFGDLPHEPVYGEARSSLIFSDTASADVIPGSLQSCQTKLKEALDKISRLEEALRQKESESQRNKDLAERYEQNCATNRRNGGRRGKS